MDDVRKGKNGAGRMSDLLSNMQIVLGEAGFTTQLISIDRSSGVCFENDSVMGFGSILEKPEEILMKWKDIETSLLTRYAPNFRAAGEKAWNVYTIFLCSLAPLSEVARQIRWIEEDLQRTRKIAVCGIASREDMIRALMPILPIQQQPILELEDATERLQRRIKTIAPKAANLVLDESVPVAEAVRLLGDLQ